MNAGELRPLPWYKRGRWPAVFDILKGFLVLAVILVGFGLLVLNS